MAPELSVEQRRHRRIVAMVLVAVAAVTVVFVAVILAAPQGLAPGGSAPQGGGPASSGAIAPASSTATSAATPPETVTPPPESQLPTIPEPPAGATVPVPVAPGPTPPPETLPAPQPPPPAAPFPPSLAGKDAEVVPGAGRSVALTFDAGGNSAGLPAILQTLAGAGIRGTFFLTGSWAAANPDGVAAIVAGGHRVGNHSQTHPDFTGLPDSGVADQVLAAERAIRAAGADPRPLFRFPFGARDARTIAAVNKLGYVPVRWSVDTLGWKGTSGGTSQQVADRALSALQPGEIVLMHVGSNPDDGSTLDADALPQMIDRMRQAGYGFITLDNMLTG